MVGWILLALFLLVYLLTAPIWLEIDSVKGYSRVRFHMLLSGETLNPGEIP